MLSSNTASILEMAKGAIMEQADIEVGKIIQNILDLNTDPTKKRKLTMTVEFTPSSSRDTVVVNVVTKSQLQPNNPIRTSLYVGVNTSTGEPMATELTAQIPGQMAMDGTEQDDPKILRLA